MRATEDIDTNLPPAFVPWVEDVLDFEYIPLQEAKNLEFFVTSTTSNDNE